jgi:nitrogen fixation/metabolism regulation signal transduction histidine kinase
MTDDTSVPAAPALTPRIGLSGVELKRMATEGAFAVDDTTGDRMIQSLEGVIDSLTARWTALAKVGQAPPMSATSTAQWVSGHMVNTANDEHGLLTQLQQARDEFPTYIEAIKMAKQNYRETEATSEQTLTKINPED